MLRFILFRLVWFIPNTLLLTFLLFAVLSGWLGSPSIMMLGLDASPEAIREMDAANGFDRPIPAQYLDWLSHALQGDFGLSFATKEHVTQMIGAALPISIELGFWAILLAGCAAVGLNSIVSRRGWLGALVEGISVVGITIPNFLLGASLIFFFSIYLRWLPTSAWAPWSDGLVPHFSHLVMPVVTLALFYFGSFSMIYQSEYRSIARQLYVRVARAKGISDSRVSFHHVLPNAVLPIITYAGISFGHLMGGAVVTEVMFSLPGLGRIFIGAIHGNDYPVILAVGIVVLTSMMVANLVADVILAWVNPQVRLAK